jgi:hypothetical protein
MWRFTENKCIGPSLGVARLRVRLRFLRMTGGDEA